MGMFDWLEIDKKVSLPMPEELKNVPLPHLELQTKSLDNTLSVYLIREDGLFLKVNEQLKNTDFHGILDFGAYECFDTVNYSLKYKAKFTDGVLSGITLCGFEEHFHESSKKRLDELMRRQKLLFKKSVFFYPQSILASFLNLFGLGLKSRSLGQLASEKFTIVFHRPNFLIFSRDKSFLEFGLFLSIIDTGIRFTRSFYEKSFCFKLLGFGVSIHKRSPLPENDKIF